ncbi:MAG: hypothetical protein M0003_09470 [Acidithiobacillus sp.]|nr:hypothetical protein [Acidithiobacillus sp.]
MASSVEISHQQDRLNYWRSLTHRIEKCWAAVWRGDGRGFHESNPSKNTAITGGSQRILPSYPAMGGADETGPSRCQRY